MITNDYAFYVAKIHPLQWICSAAMLGSMGGFVPAYKHPSSGALRPLYGALGIVPLPYHPAKKHPSSDALMAFKRLRHCSGILGYNSDTGYAPRLPSSFVPDMLAANGLSQCPADGILPMLSLRSTEPLGDEAACGCECHAAQRRLKLRAKGVGDSPARGSGSKGGIMAARNFATLQRLANSPCNCCPNGRARVAEYHTNMKLKIHNLPNTEATYCKHTESTVTVELCLLGRPHRVTLAHGQVYT